MSAHSSTEVIRPETLRSKCAPAMVLKCTRGASGSLTAGIPCLLWPFHVQWALAKRPLFDQSKAMRLILHVLSLFTQLILCRYFTERNWRCE